MSRNEFRPSDQTVKAKVFIPPRNKRLSVYRTSTISEDEIWSIGNEWELYTWRNIINMLYLLCKRKGNLQSE